MVEISRRVSDAWMGNIQLVQNLVDWTQEDTELLKIRARGNYARILKPTEPGTRRSIELGNYGFALVAVAGIAFLTLSRRRDAKPMELDARRDGEVA
jgi:hypothetical protein